MGITGEVYEAAIRDAYAAATADDIAAGRDWYPTARGLVQALADDSGLSTDRIAAIVAALSPRNPWRWNLADAATCAAAIARGDAEPPTATTFGQNRRTAWQIGTGADDWRGSAPKVRAFTRAIMGATDAVVVDVWAIRVASNGAESAVRSDAHYETVAAAYRAVAAECGETPRDLQAITWLGAQRRGIASQRRGRHDRVCKRGTLPIVRYLLDGQLSLAL
jgi:hypothetical protein